MCSGVLCSPLGPGKPAVWHTPIIGKTWFTAEPVGPAGQPVSAMASSVPICWRSCLPVFPGRMVLLLVVGCSRYWKWCMSQKKQKSILILG